MPNFVDMKFDDKGLMEKLDAMGQAGDSVSRVAVGAGCGVLAKACKAASPGSVKQECGWYIRRNSNGYFGKAGLMQFPQRGQEGRGPHGLFLTIGTRHIVARHFIENALKSARGRAIAAARRAAHRKISRLAETA